MKKSDLFLGILLGFATTFIGIFFFISLFTEYDFIEGITIMKTNNLMGKIMTLGAILNIIVFFILLKKNKELMARGIVLSTIILAVLTLFV